MGYWFTCRPSRSKEEQMHMRIRLCNNGVCDFVVHISQSNMGNISSLHTVEEEMQRLKGNVNPARVISDGNEQPLEHY